MFISSDSIARGVCICRSCRPSYGRTLARAEFLWEKEGKNEPKKEFKSTATTAIITTTAATTTAHTALEFSVFVFVFDAFIIELVKVFKFGQTSLDLFLPL